MKKEIVEFALMNKNYKYELMYFHDYEPTYGIPGNYGHNEINIWRLKEGNAEEIDLYFNKITSQYQGIYPNPVFICPPSSQPGIKMLSDKLNYYYHSSVSFPTFSKGENYPTSKTRDTRLKYDNLILQNSKSYIQRITLIDDVFTSGSTMNACYAIINEKIGYQNLEVITLARTV
jgi:hypoxanthine-guanine phosphoribosyltransferase